MKIEVIFCLILFITSASKAVEDQVGEKVILIQRGRNEPNPDVNATIHNATAKLSRFFILISFKIY